MHDNYSRAIDAELRVITSPRLDALKFHRSRTHGCVARILAAIAAAPVTAGAASRHIAGVLLAGHRKHMGLVLLSLAVLLASTGCGKEREQLSGLGGEPSEAEVRASLRKATSYQDPRAGFKPKPITVGSPSSPSKESGR